MFSPIMRIQKNDIVSATKAIIRTHVAVKRYYKYSKWKIKRTRIRVHYTMENISNLTVTLMDFQKVGFH